MHQSKAGAQPPDEKVQLRFGRQPRLAEDLVQPLTLGLGLADDVYVLPFGRGIELLPYLGNVAAEAFDRLGLQPAGRFQRRD